MSTTTPAPGRALLGFGAALDREVGWDSEGMTRLAAEHGIGPADLAAVSRGPVRTERDLVASVLDHLARGVGGERYVEEPDVLTGFADRFTGVDSLGGTCVRAAAAMRLLGRPATVHLAFDDPAVRRLLPPGTEAVVAASWEPFHPHVIVQYPQGARVRTDLLDLTAVRANRLIYVNDPANERIRLVDDLAARTAQAGTVLVSGLNAIRDPGMLEDRLEQVTAALRSRPSGSLAYYEDAGYHEDGSAAVVRNRLGRLCDVVGLNEDELAAASGVEGLDLLDAEAVQRAVGKVLRGCGAATLVVHSGRWALAHGAVTPRIVDGLRSGVAMATGRYVLGDRVTPDEAERLVAGPVDPEVERFARAVEELGDGRTSVVPVPRVDPRAPTTVGLGDTFVGGFLAVAGPP